LTFAGAALAATVAVRMGGMKPETPARDLDTPKE
jgi:hypothetical protein